MKLIKKKWFWCYLEPKSDIEQDVLQWTVNGRAGKVKAWLDANACGRWSTSNTCYYLRGDDYDYTVVKFESEDDATLFKMTFSTKEVEDTGATPVEQTWDYGERADDPKGLTFPKTASKRFFTGRTPTRGAFAGKEFRYYYATERNAAGYFVAWENINGTDVKTVRLASRTKKRCIEWARKKSEG